VGGLLILSKLKVSLKINIITNNFVVAYYIYEVLEVQATTHLGIHTCWCQMYEMKL